MAFSPFAAWWISRRMRSIRDRTMRSPALSGRALPASSKP
jgi:hypothetical protein